MVPRIQTSFIPKKSLIKKDDGRKKPISFILLVSTIVFLLALVLSGSVYLYKVSLVNEIKTSKKNLVDNQKTFEPSSIANLSRLEKRIMLADKLLKEHISPSFIFSTLEEFMLKSIRFTKLNYEVTSNNKIKIQASGEALSYGSVALQADIFGGNKYIKNQIFSGLSLNRKGLVVFDFSANIDPLLISYSENL